MADLKFNNNPKEGRKELTFVYRRKAISYSSLGVMLLLFGWFATLFSQSTVSKSGGSYWIFGGAIYVGIGYLAASLVYFISWLVYDHK